MSLSIRDVKKKALSERVVAIYPADRRPEFRDFDRDAGSHRRLSTKTEGNSPTGPWPYPTSSNPSGSPQLSRVKDGDRRYQERTTALM
jgi:hypothetical protein